MLPRCPLHPRTHPWCCLCLWMLWQTVVSHSASCPPNHQSRPPFPLPPPPPTPPLSPFPRASQPLPLLHIHPHTYPPPFGRFPSPPALVMVGPPPPSPFDRFFWGIYCSLALHTYVPMYSTTNRIFSTPFDPNKSPFLIGSVCVLW